MFVTCDFILILQFAGIIFFEMCYRPLTTAMEKSKILGNLRTKDIVFPDDFPDENQTARVVIK